MRRLPYQFAVLVTAAILALAAVAPAQRPRTAAEAIERYERVRGEPEAQRRRAVGDLGAFGDAEVTRILLDELARAEGLGLRQTVVRALGGAVRDGAVAALRAAFPTAATARLADRIAEALAAQGADGVAALVALLDDAQAGSSRWHSLCSGLGRSAAPVVATVCRRCAASAVGWATPRPTARWSC